MNESTTTQYYHKKLKAAGAYCLKLSLTHESGVPDSWISGKSGNMWIEFKYIKELPKRETTIIKTCFTELQQLWAKQRVAEGRHVVLIICTPEGDVVRHGSSHKQLTTERFKTRMVPRKQVIEWILSQVQG